MKKQISKPENWQDFESLCKKLWGEIWNIPNKIKKNGRLGQHQSGVDIYGKPKGKNNYWGIQCKGKNEYVHAELTEKEIDKELKKALEFKPQLEVFIITTTANKDVKIEEYIRLKDIEYQSKGLFEILLFCWEDIADLIEENRETYNYYINDKQFKSKFDFNVCFKNGKNEHILEPTFFRNIRQYKLGERNPVNSNFPKFDFLEGKPIRVSNVMGLSNRNHPVIEGFTIVLANTGSMTIEDWKVIFQIQGKYKENMYEKNIPEVRPETLDLNFKTSCKENTFNFNLDNIPFVQNDVKSFDWGIIPFPNKCEIPIHWKLLARDFKKEGEMILKVKPKIIDVYETIYVQSEKELMKDKVISYTYYY